MSTLGISRDIAILIASGAMRNFGFGFYNVIFAIYLAKLGFSTLTIGSVVTLATLSGVVQTLIGSILMDRYPRKRMMIFWGVLTLVGSGVMALSSDPYVVAAMSALGLIGARAGGSGAGGLGGPVMVGQVAMLADKAPDEKRNSIFAINALALHIAGSLGAFLAALPDFFHARGWSELASYRMLFAIGCVTSVFLRRHSLILSRRRAGANGCRSQRASAALRLCQYHSAEEQKIRRQNGYAWRIRQLRLVAAQFAVVLLVLRRLRRVGERDRAAVRDF